MAQAQELRPEAEAALKKAVSFFTTEVASHGGYLWQYSADLEKREGEGVFGKDTVEIQPPGTPAVGEALLQAHAATGDAFYLDAARASGDCLVRGQLRSGGWNHQVEFGERRGTWAYRIEKASKKKRDVSSLDDDKTQSAMRFMMKLDQSLRFKDETVHESAKYALAALLKAQFPNGGFPQVFRGPATPGLYEGKKRASIPKTWPRTSAYKQYWEYGTLNDNTLADAITTLFLAEDIYTDRAFRDAAEQAGDFILLAQLPEPQPAWAQQYNFDMEPAWARKFEPPAVTGGESQGVLRTLAELYRRTGKRKYLEPIPRAITYLEGSALPDGKLARFYELGTNKPLYFTKEYELTHQDNDLPTHYGFKVSNKLDRVRRDLERIARGTFRKEGSEKPSEKEVRRVVAGLDARGAWVEDGKLKYHKDDDTKRVITCRTFIRNVNMLSRYLAK